MEIRGRGQNDKPQHRVNEQIRAASVRVVGENVEAGVYPLKEALAMAEAAGADLVEISPNADPPVCSQEREGRCKGDPFRASNRRS